jgi:hypothetical protein
MPNPSSYADFIRDWESLLGAARDHAALLPDVERHRDALAQHLETVKALKGRQDLLLGSAKRATQELQAGLEEGRKLAIRLRGAIKANLGHDNRLLEQFGIASFPRPRRRKPSEPAPEPAPETPPAPAPAGGTGTGST